jgi:hypothetical protein
VATQTQGEKMNVGLTFVGIQFAEPTAPCDGGLEMEITAAGKNAKLATIILKFFQFRARVPTRCLP